MSQSFSVVGKSVKRINGPDLLTGRAKFSIDVYRPGMLYGRVLTSPYAHAKITSIDASKALALSGVKAVVTYLDAPSTVIPPDLRALESEVRFVGDEVAAVAATDPEIAEAALDLINVTYQQLPAVFTTADALKSGAPLVHADFAGNLVPSQTITVPIGNVDAALAASNKVYEGDFTTPRQIIAGINPQVAVAEWSGDGKLTVWDSNQCPYDRQGEIATVLGLPLDKVTVVSDYCGCGFGEDNKFRYVLLAPLLAKKAGAPVKLEPGKKYQFEASPKKRHPMSCHAKLGINTDGTINAISTLSVWDKGAYAFGGQSVPVVGAGATTGLYRVKASKFVCTVVYTNNPPSGAFRGYGDPQGHFPVESLVNMAAEDLGMDPMQIRLKNHVIAGDISYAGAGNPLSTVGLDKCINQGAQALGWQSKWQPFKSKTSTGTVKSGVGMGILVHTSGDFYDATSASVMMNDDGTAVVSTSVSEMGTGVATVLAQIAAEELGVRYEDIRMDIGSTDLPHAGTQDATRTVHTTGETVRRAAADVKSQLLPVAAKILKVQASALAASGGSFYVAANPSQSVKISDVLADPSIAHSVVGHSSAHFPEGNLEAMAFGANFVELQVDTETGQVKLLTMAYAHDCGRTINPMTALNMTWGGTVQGIGMAMAEDFVIDQNNGTSLTSNYLDYGMSNMASLPKIIPILVDSIDTLGPYGAKGIGECPIILPIASISAGIYNATGKWLNAPFTPANVLHALGKA